MKQTSRFTKAQRLRSPAQFRRVYQSKQWGGSTHHTFNVLFELNAQENTEREIAKFGVTVSKKVSKLAVSRNRIKRQAREFYRHKQYDLMSGVELVITARPSCNKASDEQRLKSLTILWEKILKWQRWQQKQV